MSKSEVSAPVSSVASDRLALGVGWVRPGVAGIGGSLNPSLPEITRFTRFVCAWCREGSEE